MPGGRLEEDETWLAGLKREILEETGIENFSIEKIMDVDTSDSHKSYIVTFLCRVKDSPVINLSNEHQEYTWLDLKEIDRYEFWHEKIKERLILSQENDIRPAP